MAGEDFVLELSPEEITALEAAYPAAAPELKPVVIAKEPTEKKAEAQPEKAKPEHYSETLRKRAEDAERIAGEERAKRVQAEKAASETTKKLAMSDVGRVESQHAAVVNGLAMRKSEMDAVKARHSSAMETGDYKAVTEAAERMASLQAEMRDLTAGKEELETLVSRTRASAKAEIERPAPKDEHSDPVEAYIQSIPGAREQAWLREHKECATDPELNAKVLMADAQAKKKGIQPGTDAYFSHLDKVMGYGEAAETEETVERGETDDQRAAAKAASAPAANVAQPEATAKQPAKRVAAPVSRDGVLAKTADGRTQLVLSASQAEMADSLGIPRTKYAMQLYKLEQGNRDPNYSGPRLGQQSN